METSLEAERLLVSAARQSLQSAIAEQRASSDDLRGAIRELDTILQGLTGGENGRPVIAGTPSRPNGMATAPVQERISVAWPDSFAHLQREAERIQQRGKEIALDTAAMRGRCKQLRASIVETVEPVRASPDAPTKPRTTVLSKREAQVLTLIVEGKSSKEIAAALGISFKTAVTHRASIMSKIDVHEIASLVREAIYRGLV